MFSPVRVVAAAAILALGGSLALMTALGPSEAPGPAAAPSAEDIAYVTGTATYVGDTAPCTIESTPLYTEKRGCGLEYEWVTDDPRLSGLQSAAITRRDFRGTQARGMAAIIVTGRLENDAGAWIEGYGDPDPMLVRPGGLSMGSLAVLQGTGEYEGLTALVYTDSSDEGAIFDIEGAIIPTEMLPDVP